MVTILIGKILLLLFYQNKENENSCMKTIIFILIILSVSTTGTQTRLNIVLGIEKTCSCHNALNNAIVG